MSSALFARQAALVAATPAADQRDKEGYLVNLTSVSGVLTSTVSSSATVVAEGVILEGQNTTGKSTIGIHGALSGTVRVKLSGPVSAGDKLQQAADGTLVTDAGTGARAVVGIALEDGVSGDLIEAALFTPLTLS